MSKPNRLILVDGSSLIYRAYYAIPANFATSAGLPTNAIYGFATMFRKVLSGRTPEYGAVVFDAPGPTLRAQRYPEYKSHRPRMDSELKQQLPWIDKLVRAHHFPLLRLPGYEADDIIATLCAQAEKEKIEVHIISGDKDFAQLISEQVRMVDTLRDIVYTPEAVQKKWGVSPEKFVDWQAMVGDKADNIPGVPGIGAKGAMQLLERFGDLDTILNSTDELKGKQKRSLEENRQLAELSKELATLDREVPLEKKVEDLKLDLPENSSLNELYRELEFFSLLSQEEASEGVEASEGKHDLLLSQSAIQSFIRSAKKADYCAIYPIYDGESPLRGQLCALCFCFEEGKSSTLPLIGPTAYNAGLSHLQAWLEKPNTKLVAHNGKEVWIALTKLGIELAPLAGDTALESFLVDPTRLIPHRIDQLAREYLQRSLAPSKEILGAGKKAKKFSQVDAHDYKDWCGLQALSVWQSWPKIRAELEKREQLDYLDQIDLPLARLLGQMELDGILVDPESLQTMGEEFAARLSSYEQQIYKHAGHEFNIASTKQLSKVLFEELELPVIKRTKTGYSTNAEVLQKLLPKHPIAAVLLDHRKLAKLINTYTDVLQREVNPETGRIHASFQQTVGATGRLISTDPDLQRTPIKTPEGARIRETFIAKDGCKLISADWSQIELRLLAHVSSDPLLVESFTKGWDVHARTASELFDVDLEDVSTDQRRIGKLVNFATIYGQGATALGQILGVPRKEAKGYIEQYFEAYAGVRTWLDETMEQSHQEGYVTTLFGRRRYIPELSSNSFMIRQAGERIAANTPIQGSAADLCKLAMLNIQKELARKNLKTKMLLQIHDELIFEVPTSEVEEISALVKDEMESVYELRVPLIADVGVGDNWRQAH